MDSKSENFQLKPVFVNSVFTITASGNFHQVLTYDYLEETERYFSKIQTDEVFFQKEVETIHVNMQHFMDIAHTTVNNVTVYPQVIESDIDFKDAKHPYFYWIIEFHGEFESGLNEYKNIIERERLDYDVSSIYIFEKPMKIDEVKTAMHYEILDNQRIIKYWGNKGEMIGRIEIVKFLL